VGGFDLSSPTVTDIACTHEQLRNDYLSIVMDPLDLIRMVTRLIKRDFIFVKARSEPSCRSV